MNLSAAGAPPGWMPNLIIPGVQKSGTTYLVTMLAQHPDVYLPIFKEPAYFLAIQGSILKFPNQVHRHFAIDTLDKYRELYAGHGTTAWRVDATTAYFQNPECAALIGAQLPQARILIVLRNPVARAFSAYCFYRQNQQEPLNSFADAIAVEETRLAQSEMTWAPYKATGLYAQHLKNWRRAFPDNQMKVILFEDLISDPLATTADIGAWLGLSDFVYDIMAEKNVSYTPTSPLEIWLRSQLLSDNRYNGVLRRTLRGILPPQWRQRLRTTITTKLGRWNTSKISASRAHPADNSKPLLLEETRVALNAYFAEDIAELSDLLKRDLNHWIDP